MSTTFTGTDLLGQIPAMSVDVRPVRKFAPCGCCGRMVSRDDMWALNTKMFSPNDQAEVRVQIRLCPSCADTQLASLRAMEWDNSRMVVSE